MSQFPRLLYKTPPARPGPRADMREVKSQEELDQALGQGWHMTISQANEASGFVYQKPVPKPLPVRPKLKPKLPPPVNKLDPKWAAERRAKAEAAQSAPAPEPAVPADDAPPTRAELEAKATELNIPFNGRTSDKKLGKLIQTALEQGG